MASELRSLLASGLCLAVFLLANTANGQYGGNADKVSEDYGNKKPKENEGGYVDSVDSYEKDTHQRFFEYLSNQISRNGYSDQQRGYMYQQIQNHPDYQDAVGKCLDSVPPVLCEPLSPYRTYDGSCNNLMYPSWGKVEECIQRLMPVYYDGAYGIRRSVTGGPLPRPRDLSNGICSGPAQPAKDISFLFAVFGQFVAHEISLSAPGSGDPSLKCCPPSNEMDESCDPILIRPNDPFYSKYNFECKSNLRTPPCKKCAIGIRQQANQVTPAIDGSMIYSTSEEIANQLRANDGTGTLLSSKTKYGELLPKDENAKMFCPRERSKCFKAGDDRVNQHSGLMSMHTLFMREHNRIAVELKNLNPDWDEETLFQEARRICVAEFQVIIYKELMPWLVGPKLMDQFGLWISPDGGGTQYNPNVRLGAYAEFSSGVYRLHSMINTQTGYNNATFKDLYFNTNILHTGKMKPLLKALRQTPAIDFSWDVVEDVRNYLYWPPGLDYGYDLAAVDIERGRDHGLPPYVRFISFCFNGKEVRTFDDLAFLMEPDAIQLLKDNYDDIQDVDVWIGMMMERHVPGAGVGPTVACISARQFFSLKYGDRFYFEHVGQQGSFTEAQRRALKNCTMSRLICDNTKICEMQWNALLLPGPENEMMSCKSHPRVDLSAWKM